jgi:cardiolipin synthase
MTNKGVTGTTTSAGTSLLLGGATFWERLKQDILEARDYVYVQTLSFEGDRAGGGLTEALIASPAKKKRVVADAFTKHIINDRWLLTRSARRDEDLQKEVRATYAMFDRLERSGVPIRFAWPIVGRRYHRLIVRNHKKLIAIDDRIAYLGGINFSDHNFAWHDFMVRIKSPGITAFLRDDFDHTWEGRDQDVATVIDGDELIIGDGRGNQGMRDAVTRVIDEARDRIILQCPYVGEPFWRLLGHAHRRGVRVTIVMPENHNRSIMKWGTLNAARRHGFEFRLLPGSMIHTKAMRVDDAMILGSANFDFIGFWHQPEIVFICRQPDLVREINTRVLTPDLARSVPINPGTEKLWLQHVAGVGMAISERLAFLARERKPSPAPPDPSH